MRLAVNPLPALAYLNEFQTSNSQTDKPDFPQEVRLLHVFTFVVLSHYTPK